MIINSPIEYVSITIKCVFRILSFLKRTKNRVVSETKNSAAPIAVISVAAEKPLTQRNIAKQFIVPFISKYRYIG